MIEFCELAIDEKEKRDTLKATRNRLFDQFVRNPSHMSLAITIKEIDDQLADSLARSSTKRRARRVSQEEPFNVAL